VVIVDANVLLYTVDETSAQHHGARRWLEAALAGTESIGFAWVVLLAFVRIASNPSIYPHPLSTDAAMGQVEAWLKAPAAVVVHPTQRHAGLLRGVLTDSGTAGNRTTDAHLATLALEHRADLVSYDRDFARFRDLRHRLPG
jgi:toxin-antitoxin system PIN domain toxin